MTPTTKKRFAAAVAATLTVAATGCSIQADSSPREVPAEKAALSTPSSAGGDAAGGDRIFLVGPGPSDLLRSVPRDATSPAALIEILLRGPNEAELAEEYSTVIPAETEAITVRTQGSFLTVDLTDDLTQLTGQSLMRAVAQIVYTGSEIDGVDAVQIRIDSEPVSLPKWNGESTTDALRVYDYPDFVETAQPPYPSVGSGA